MIVGKDILPFQHIFPTDNMEIWGNIQDILKDITNFFRGAADLQYEGQAVAGRPPDLPGGCSGQVEVQVLLPVRILQEVQSS